ncbi:MAG: TetR/AcrR family transcriptional regulator [Planctomycetes bacterium]|nr:TetR/AcrR family transcriptional regulator [Planctomycetota bacterium]
MPSLDRRAREKAAVQEKILDAAREQFLSGGYEAVSLRKIAEAIEYTPPAIYTHFKDKTDLLREVCRRDFAALDEVFLKLGTVADPVERIYRIGTTYIRFAHEHPKHYRFMFMTPGLATVVPPTAEDLAQANDPDQDAYAFLVMTVKQAIAAGRFREEYAGAELSAQTLWAGVHGVASLEVTHAECPWVRLGPLEARSGAMCAAVLRGMLKNPAELEAFA